MQPNPKKIKPATNQDYASIYEDNFIKTNDPVALGQQAFTRQLSQGVQTRLQTPTPQPAAAQGTYFDRINPTAQMDPQENFSCPEGYVLVNGACQRIVEERNWLQQVGDTVTGAIGDFGQNISSAVANAFQPASTIVGKAGQVASQVVSDAVTPTMENIAQTGSQIGATVSNRVNPIGSAFGSAANKTFTGQEGAQADFQKGIGLTQELIKDLDKRGGDIIREQVVPAIQQGAITAAEAVQKFPGTVSNYFQEEVMPRLDQAGKFATGDRFGAYLQESTTGKSLGDGEMTDNAVNEAVTLVEDIKTEGVLKTLEKRIQQPLAKAVTDAMFAAAGGDEKVVEAVTEAITPFLQENVDPYFTGEKTIFDDMGIEVPGWLTNKNPTTVFGDYQNAFDKSEEETGPTLPEDNGTGGDAGTGGTGGTGETKKPGDIRTGGGETKGGEIGLADADTGDYSQVEITPTTVTVDKETGESTTEDLTNVSNTVSNEVQTRMTELTTQLTQQISQAEQYYAREYDRILNQIAMRGRQSQVGGFTGGIQEQIAQFASAAEIQQLNALAVERNNTIQGLQAQFANIPLQAQQYANEMLTAQLQNENIRTQALSTLYTDVLNGVRTIEDAQAFADQYGLGNISDLMGRVAAAQLGDIEGTGVEGEVTTDDVIDALVAAGVDPEILSDDQIQAIVDEKNGVEEPGNMFEDINLDDWKLADPISNLDYNTYWTGWFGATSETEYLNAIKGLNEAFGTTDEAKQLQYKVSRGDASFELIRSDENPRHAGLNDTYSINVDGKQVQLEGYQIMMLAATMKADNVAMNDNVRAIMELALKVRGSLNYQTTSAALFGTTGSQTYDGSIKIFDNIFGYEKAVEELYSTKSGFAGGAFKNQKIDASEYYSEIWNNK